MRNTTAQAALDDLIGAERIAALNDDLGRAKGLPGAAYGADFYRLEQTDFFPRLWCPVAFASDLPDPGDAYPVDLAGWQILLIRDKAGTLRAFHNVCRHRAMQPISAPCKGLSHITCPWHAWSYGLDGKLAATPTIGGERENTAPGFDKADTDLRPVGVAQWFDLIFVNIDGQAPPFDEHIAPLAELVSEFDHTKLARAEDWSTVYPANWKVTVESVLEEYHIPFGHPQLARGVRRHNPMQHSAGRTFMASSNDREYTDRAKADTAMGMPGVFPSIRPAAPDGTTPNRSHFIVVAPTGAMQTRSDHMLLGLMLPDGPASTNVRFAHYYVGDAATDPALVPVRDKLVEAWKVVFAQDVDFVRATQANHSLRDEVGLDTRFSPYWEGNLRQFQRMVVEVIRGD
jgi:choline monooxygenase